MPKKMAGGEVVATARPDQRKQTSFQSRIERQKMKKSACRHAVPVSAIFFVFWPWIIGIADLFSMCIFGNTVSAMQYSGSDFGATGLAMIWPVLCFCIVIFFNN